MSNEIYQLTRLCCQLKLIVVNVTKCHQMVEQRLSKDKLAAIVKTTVTTVLTMAAKWWSSLCALAVVLQQLWMSCMSAAVLTQQKLRLHRPRQSWLQWSVGALCRPGVHTLHIEIWHQTRRWKGSGHCAVVPLVQLIELQFNSLGPLVWLPEENCCASLLLIYTSHLFASHDGKHRHNSHDNSCAGKLTASFEKWQAQSKMHRSLSADWWQSQRGQRGLGRTDVRRLEKNKPGTLHRRISQAQAHMHASIDSKSALQTIRQEFCRNA